MACGPSELVVIDLDLPKPGQHPSAARAATPAAGYGKGTPASPRGLGPLAAGLRSSHVAVRNPPQPSTWQARSRTRIPPPGRS
ncbi:hypothetical protein [Nonomuraea sp. NPDC049141]|uniref:hypothetical protein n=1 Tax=Nonomuraea sp. NPDC049141 TaxID=3155500 RepID=UPI0033D0B836